MAELASLDQAPPRPALSDHHRRVIATWLRHPPLAQIDAPLIPRTEREAIAPTLRHELAGELGPQRARHAAAGLLACWPSCSAPFPERWAAAVAEELKHVPEAIARDALRRVRREIKFLPAVAEIVSAVRAAELERRDALAALELMDRAEIQRAQEHARDDARARARAELSRWAAAAELAEGNALPELSDCPPTASEFRDARHTLQIFERAAPGFRLDEWVRAAEAGASWAARLARIMAPVSCLTDPGRVRQLIAGALAERDQARELRDGQSREARDEP